MRINTLKRNKEFRFVYGKGKSVSTKLLVLICIKKRKGGLRPGFSISKKIGGAVQRNKTRRRLKAAYAEIFKEYSESGSFDAVFIARQPIADAEYTQIKGDMRSLMLKSGLICKIKPNKEAELTAEQA